MLQTHSPWERSDPLHSPRVLQSKKQLQAGTCSLHLNSCSYKRFLEVGTLILDVEDAARERVNAGTCTVSPVTVSSGKVPWSSLVNQGR